MTSHRLHAVDIVEDSPNDTSHFVQREGLTFAGRHLLIDMWESTHIDNLDHVERALRAAVEAVGATLLRIDLHHFTENDGVSGVAVLAESHMSIHTWPECGYAALDVFVCGECDPTKAVPVLKAAFNPGRVQVSEHKRGIVS